MAKTAILTTSWQLMMNSFFLHLKTKGKPKPVKDVMLKPSYDLRRQDVEIHRVIQLRQSKHMADEDSSGAGGKAVCRAFRKDGKTIQRPPRPK